MKIFFFFFFYEQPNKDYPNGYGYLYFFVNKNSLANRVQHLLQDMHVEIFLMFELY